MLFFAETTPVSEFLPQVITLELLHALIILVVGLPSVFLVSNAARRVVSDRLGSSHAGLVAYNLFFYTGIFILVTSLFLAFDLNISALLGTAGVISIVLGIAAQASVSNLISGLFLLAEKPFEMGDIITIEEKRGYVIAVNLMSVHLRTIDNRFVRVSNESLLKNSFINETRFPIRRFDLLIPLKREVNLDQVFRTLQMVAENDHHTLDEPPICFMFEKIDDTSITLRYGTWCRTPDYFGFSSNMIRLVQQAFSQQGLEFAYPHRILVQSDPSPMPPSLEDDDLSTA